MMRNWIQTYSGIAFVFEDVINNKNDEAIQITDIAHALSYICRYNGHVKRHYSVAEHSILLAQYAGEKGKQKRECLTALLHDAAEAYIGDITAPLKEYSSKFKEFEDKLLEKIFIKYKAIWPIPNWIKEWDRLILKNERDTLLENPEKHIWSIDKNTDFLDIRVPHLKQDPDDIKKKYLELFYQLQ